MSYFRFYLSRKLLIFYLEIWKSLLLNRVVLVVGFSLSFLYAYAAIPFWLAEFLLKDQLLALWGSPQILLLFYFSWRTIILWYCDSFCHTSTWISCGCKCVPPSWTPLPPPSSPYPSRLYQTTDFSVLLHASNLHWSSILHMVIYMFQWYPFISSHPRLLPHSLKVCSLYLCLFCCLPYRIVITIFINFINMH